MNKINIAIDGPAGSGKSTIAVMVADKLGYIYINTGLMYRAIAYKAIQLGISLEDKNEIISLLKPNMIKLLPNETVELDDKKLKDELRSDDVSSGASKVAAINEVRDYCVREQQIMAQKKGIVMDGRDITSVVLPNAEVKIFLWASVEERVNRRLEQNSKIGYSVDADKIKREIEERDYRDSHREVGPLIQVPDAIRIDSTNLTINEVVERIIKETR